ncbi:hypothetical protein [Streptomyces sp. H27-D2]|uniref:hypothetical protein n=1 Tax=Streptomyces sp. H27-D2 TaxID=3046304 RepID=UPI002DBBB559|nr:hypothetical protein [Streptomyces sp. H27-D2]MEC4014919.1 hypothetical protein [Streptomyces sp. H27-D2]
MLRLCATGKLRCSEKTRRPGAATVEAVAGVLDIGDFYPHEAIAAFAWPMLLQAGGLTQLTNGRLALTPRGNAALTRPPHLTIAQLWQRCLNNSLLDEFSRVEEIKGQRAANVLTASEPRRKIVGQALTGLTPRRMDLCRCPVHRDARVRPRPRCPPQRARPVEAAHGCGGA